MPTKVLTQEDLQHFKHELIIEIKKLVNESAVGPHKRWIKAEQVRKILDISSNSLRTLRLNGTFKFCRLGGAVYYDLAHIKELFQGAEE
jgi:hypothetical protein